MYNLIFASPSRVCANPDPPQSKLWWVFSLVSGRERRQQVPSLAATGGSNKAAALVRKQERALVKAACESWESKVRHDA